MTWKESNVQIPAAITYIKVTFKMQAKILEKVDLETSGKGESEGIENSTLRFVLIWSLVVALS